MINERTLSKLTLTKKLERENVEKIRLESRIKQFLLAIPAKLEDSAKYGSNSADIVAISASKKWFKDEPLLENDMQKENSLLQVAAKNFLDSISNKIVRSKSYSDRYEWNLVAFWD